MIALAKRVQARGAAVAGTSAAAPAATSTAVITDRRGPRNQPKRKGRK
jgi:hypothetical protein